MEDAQRTYNHEDEVRRMYENIGDEGTIQMDMEKERKKA
jgi:hypothetical protein